MTQTQQLEQEVTLRYYPFLKQMLFHRDRYKIRHRAVFSGVGGGKTICGCFEMLSMLLENPKSVGYIFEPTYKMVRRILIPTLESKWLLGHPIDSNPIVSTYNKSENLIQFIDGQSLWFGGLEEPQFAEGANVDVVLLDEAQYISKFAESQDVVLRRLRGSGKTPRDITCSIVTTSPPPLVPDCRLYDFYENPEKRNLDSKVYRWSMLDNSFLPEKYKQEILATHHGALAKRFVEGLFAPVGTGSFDYDSTIHEFSQQLQPDLIQSVIYGCDFGWTNPSAIVCVGFDGDGRAYILDEFYQNRTQTETLISELKEMLAEHGQGKIICDRSSPATIEMLRTADLNAVADESKRDDGIRELGGRFIVQGDGKPRIYVASKCVNLIHEVMVYNSEIKENDHAVDALRYAIMSVMMVKPDVEPAWVFGD
jgi:Terminase large subunit, T4likevirus-type, N-terminal